MTLRPCLKTVIAAVLAAVDSDAARGGKGPLLDFAVRDEAAVAVAPIAVQVSFQADAALRLLYDDILAIARPLGRRDLRWHYADLDIIDEAEARRRLDAR